MKRQVFALTVAILFVVLPAKDIIRASTSSYTIEDLGTTSDGLVPVVTGMNASGQVSGYVNASTGPRAVRFTGSSWENVPGVSAYSVATAINASGDVAGYHLVAGMPRAFRYTYATGVAETISLVTGGSMAWGFAINASGDVTGYGDASGAIRGWLAKPGYDTVVLSALGDGVACGMNDAGQIVGFYMTASGYQHAYRLEVDGSVTDIVPFDGPAGTGTACAIDAAGRVGGAATSSNLNRAFVFDSVAPVNVDVFGGTDSNIAAVAGGVSVGWYTLATTAKAFVHTDENGSANLNDLIPAGSGWQLDQAFAVNAAGQIAGNGRLNGQARAFRLTPVKDTTAPVISDVAATPSTVWPPNGALVPVTVSWTVTDDTDPAPVCSLSSLTASETTVDGSGITGAATATVRAVGGVTYTLTVTCTDAFGNSSSASTSVVVPPDVTAPVISLVQATPDAIWPPNGKMVPVTVSVSATDDVDATPQCALTSVSSNGGEADDAVVTGQSTASLRAEKNANDSLRVYSLHVKCSDKAGNESAGVTTVAVAKDANAVSLLRATKVKTRL